MNYINNIQICDACLQAYEQKDINGIRTLKVFNGYTIDLRLKQFRKVPLNELPEFIEFDSKEGQALLQKMHLALQN